MSGFGKCWDCRESHLLCDLPKVMSVDRQISDMCRWAHVTRVLCAKHKNASWVFSLGDLVLESLFCAQRLLWYIRIAYLGCSAEVRGTRVGPPWRIELCCAKWFGLFLCVTTFWRRGWPISYPYYRSIPSNRPAVWVPAGTDGKHNYNITSMPEKLLLTIANDRFYLNLPGRLFKTSLLPYQTLGPLARRRLLRWTRTWLLRRAYNLKDKPLGRLIKRQTKAIAQCVTRLHQLREHWDFDNYSLDQAIKDQLIEQCNSTRLRRRLLCEKSTASRSSFLDIARSMESANFQATNIENDSSQERSENAHQLTRPTISEEDKRQQCTHCGNQRDHQPRTPDALLFVRHVRSAESYTILDTYVWKEPQIQVTQMANGQRYPRPGMFVILQMRMNVTRHFISTLTKQTQTSQLPFNVHQFKFVLILVQQRTQLTMQHKRRLVPQKQCL